MIWELVVPTAMFVAFTGFLALTAIRSKSRIEKLRKDLQAEQIRMKEAAAEAAAQARQPVQEEMEQFAAYR